MLISFANMYVGALSLCKLKEFLFFFLAELFTIFKDFMLDFVKLFILELGPSSSGSELTRSHDSKILKFFNFP